MRQLDHTGEGAADGPKDKAHARLKGLMHYWGYIRLKHAFLLVWNQLSFTRVSFNLHLFQVLSTASGDNIILTTSNVFLRWEK